jgi:hypothetical protein
VDVGVWLNQNNISKKAFPSLDGVAFTSIEHSDVSVDTTELVSLLVLAVASVLQEGEVLEAKCSFVIIFIIVIVSRVSF